MRCTFPYSLGYSRLILSIALGCRDTRNARTTNGLSPRIDTRVVVGLQFRIPHSTLMDMSAHKNATRRAIGKDFWISERMSQASSDTAKVGPKGVDLAVDEKRFRDIVVRDESARFQMEHLATVLVLSKSRPFVWGKVGGTGERTELFVTWVSMCVWGGYSVS
jgi:hypothetical protein